MGCRNSFILLYCPIKFRIPDKSMRDLQSNRVKYTLAVMALILLASGCEPVETSSATPTTNVTISDAPESQPASTVSPQVVAQVQQLNQEIGELTDRVEVLEFELDKSRKRQKQLYDDLDLRLRKFERLQSRTEPETNVQQPEPDAEAEPTQSDSSTQSEATDVSEQEQTEPSVDDGTASQPETVDVDPQVIREAYDEAFRTLKTGDFEEAETKFRLFIEQYPSSNLVDDAWYWIAEANYITKKFDQAIKLYQFVARGYPEYQRAHEALLKIGYIYYEQGNFEEAQLYLNEILDKFPASRSAFSAQRRLNKMKRDGNIQ